MDLSDKTTMTFSMLPSETPTPWDAANEMVRVQGDDHDLACKSRRIGLEELETLERVVNYLETANNILEEDDEDEEDIKNARDLIGEAREVLKAIRGRVSHLTDERGME